MQMAMETYLGWLCVKPQKKQALTKSNSSMILLNEVNTPTVTEAKRRSSKCTGISHKLNNYQSNFRMSIAATCGLTGTWPNSNSLTRKQKAF